MELYYVGYQDFGPKKMPVCKQTQADCCVKKFLLSVVGGNSIQDSCNDNNLSI